MRMGHVNRIVLALAVLAVAGFASSASAMPVLYYDFEGGGAYSNLGTLGGSGTESGAMTAAVAAGPVGGNRATPANAVEFIDDGGNTSTWIGTGYDANTIGMQGAVDYTAAAWIHPTAFGGGGNNDNMVFGQANNGNVLHLGLRNNGNTHFGHWGNDSGGASVPLNQWTHVAYRYAGGNQDIFVNGALIASNARGGLNNGGGEVIIGDTRPADQNRDFVGWLDDVAIFNSGLEDAHINALANGLNPLAAPPGPPPLPKNLTPGFAVQAFNITDGGGLDGNLDSVAETLPIWQFLDANPGHTGAANINGTSYNIANNLMQMPVNEIDYAGGGGNFGVNNPYTDIAGGAGLGGDDFSVRASAWLGIPAGEWSIAIASDDGRVLSLTGIVFDAAVDQEDINGVGFENVIGFNGTTGHDQSVGHITITPDMLTHSDNWFKSFMDGFFFERGGGDSFEISIAAGHQGSHNGNFVLLEDGALGWIVSKSEFTNPVPEPATVGLAMMAIAGLGLRRRRRQAA